MPTTARSRGPGGRHADRALLVALAALTLSTAAPATAGVAEIVAEYGVRPIAPPFPATDFELPRTTGGTGALSDFQGQWVVLTFWATWCGPCRMEMPTLERLHRRRADRGVAIVGVSVDRTSRPLDPFIAQHDLTFPMFWDRQGATSNTYRASSIPLTYLIDPSGLAVALSRGARDWSELEPMVDRLLAEHPADPDAEAAGAGANYAAAGEMPLPPVLDPPTAEVSLREPAREAGEPIWLDVRLSWAGRLDEYLPHPPKVHLPEGVTQEEMTASSASSDGANVVTYEVRLAAADPGHYALDPVEIRYTPRFESSPLATRVAGPTVEVGPRTLAGLSPRKLLATGGGTIAAGLALFAFLRSRAGRGGDGRNESAEGDYRDLKTRFDAARALRLQGEGAAFVLALAEIERELSGDEPAIPDSLVEQVRYGARVPPREELDRVERRIERRLEASRPDPEGTARRALRLKETTG